MSDTQIKIVQTDYKPDHNEIITVHWTASLVDGEYTASSYGAEGFQPDPESPNFVPFEQLTEADVVQWLKDKEGWFEQLESGLAAQIENQKNPPVLKGLPWSASDEV